jgi:hypothetical protein
MAIAKAVNLRVRPIQAADLSFPIGGTVSAQADRHLLGKRIQGFDLTSFCNQLSRVSSVRPDPRPPGAAQYGPVNLPDGVQPLGWGRLTFDSSAIREALNDVILFELRADAVKAAVDKAIVQRENTWIQKFEKNVYLAMRETYNKFDPNSKMRRIERLATISQVQHDRMETEYLQDDNAAMNYGVIKQTVTNSTTGVIPCTTTATSTPVGKNITQTTTEEAWKPGVKPVNTSNSNTTSTDYTYRYPRLENDAQYQRAQSSLLEERVAAMAATNYSSGDNYEFEDLGGLRYFMNDLRSLDLDVRLLQLAYVNTLLISPIDGLVTGLYRNVGDSVSAGQPVVRVEDDSEIYVVGLIKLPHLVHVGQAATVTTQLFDSGQKADVNGSVVAVRGHDSGDEIWDVLIRCSNRDTNGDPIFPINYNFDFDAPTTVELT